MSETAPQQADTEIPESIESAFEATHLGDVLPEAMRKAYERVPHEAAQTLTEIKDRTVLSLHPLIIYVIPSSRNDRMFVGLHREDFTHGFFVPETVAFTIVANVLSTTESKSYETNEWFENQLF